MPGPATSFVGPEESVVVDIPGVGEVEFPVTMSQEDVSRAAAKLYSDATPLGRANATPLSEPTTYEAGRNQSFRNTLKGFVGGVGASITDLPSDILKMSQARQAYGTPAQQSEEAAQAQADPYALGAARGMVTSMSDPHEGGKMVGSLGTALGMPRILPRVTPSPNALAKNQGAWERGATNVSNMNSTLTGAVLGGRTGAILGAVAPPVMRGIGKAVGGTGRMLGGRTPPPVDPFTSTMPGGARGSRVDYPERPYSEPVDIPDSPNASGTRVDYPERPYSEPVDIPDSPNASGTRVDYPERPYTEPAPPPDSPNATGTSEWYQERPAPPPGPVPPDAPIHRKAGEAPPSTTVGKSQREVFDETFGELLDQEQLGGTTPPEPTITSMGREGEGLSSGRPSVAAAGQDAAEGWAGWSVGKPPPPTPPKAAKAKAAKKGSAPEATATETKPPASDLEQQLRDSLEKESRVSDVTRRLSDEYGSRDTARILGQTKDDVKTARGSSVSVLPERARANIDKFLATHPSPAEFKAWLKRGRGGVPLADAYTTSKLKAQGLPDDAIAEMMKR